MDGIIQVKVKGSYLSKDSDRGGVRGEANVTLMRIEFSEDWMEFEDKRITFLNALGRNPTEKKLTDELLEEGADSTYLCFIPGEAYTHDGWFSFVIDGYAEGVRKRSVEGKLECVYAPSVDGEHLPADYELAEIKVMSGTRDVVHLPKKGVYFGKVIALGDEDLIPENIKEGVEILGVVGRYGGEEISLQEKEEIPKHFPWEVTADEPNGGLSKVTLNADPKLLPENIKAGETIFGVDGSYQGGELEPDFHVISNYQQYTASPNEGFYGIKNIIVDSDPALTPSVLKVGTTAYGIKGSFGVFQTPSKKWITTNGDYTFKAGAGYDALEKVDINVNVPTEVNEVKANLVDLYVTPGYSTQTFSREGVTGEDEVHGYDYVRVYGDTDLISSNIRKGATIFGVAGSYEKTEVIELELESKTEYLTDFPFIVLPSTGKDAMRSVTIRSGDDDFKASNIKAGVNIFGVTGNYIGEEIRTQYKSVTPDHFPYYVEPDTPEYNGLHEVKINADSNLIPSNIRNGATIFGVKGTYESPMQELTLIPPIDGGVYGPGVGFKGISKVILEPIELSKLNLTNLDEVKF